MHFRICKNYLHYLFHKIRFLEICDFILTLMDAISSIYFALKMKLPEMKLANWKTNSIKLNGYNELVSRQATIISCLEFLL